MKEKITEEDVKDLNESLQRNQPDYKACWEELYQVKHGYDMLKEERNRVEEELDEMTKERDELQRETEFNTGSRELPKALLLQHMRLDGIWQEMVIERDTLKKERDQLKEELKGAEITINHVIDEGGPKHEEIITDGILRYKENPVIRWMADHCNLNELWIAHTNDGVGTREQMKQMYRDIGYSLGGFVEIFEEEDEHGEL